MRLTSPPDSDFPDLIGLLRRQALERPEQGYSFRQRSGLTRLTFAQLDRQARALAARVRWHIPRRGRPSCAFLPACSSWWAFSAACMRASPRRLPIRRAPGIQTAAWRPLPAIHPPRLFSPHPTCCATRTDWLRKRLRLAALPWLDAGSDEDVAAAMTGSQSHFRKIVRRVLQYTSGSTAIPKGVMLTQDCILHNLSRMQEILGLTARLSA